MALSSQKYEFIDLAFDFHFLKPSREILILARDGSQVMVHHRIPMVPGFALRAIPVHWPVSSCVQYRNRQ